MDREERRVLTQRAKSDLTLWVKKFLAWLKNVMVVVEVNVGEMFAELVFSTQRRTVQFLSS